LLKCLHSKLSPLIGEKTSAELLLKPHFKVLQIEELALINTNLQERCLELASENLDVSYKLEEQGERSRQNESTFL